MYEVKQEQRDGELSHELLSEIQQVLNPRVLLPLSIFVMIC